MTSDDVEIARAVKAVKTLALIETQLFHKMYGRMPKAEEAEALAEMVHRDVLLAIQAKKLQNENTRQSA
jgi:hypothetical protein